MATNTLTVPEGQPVTPLKWFEFRQNNSGGVDVVDPGAGIDKYVWVQARNHQEANVRAEQIGLYFNGCETGQDCDCCGDRWYEQWNEDDGTTEEPALSKWKLGGRWITERGAYAHRYDGTFYRVTDAREVS